MNVYYNEFDKKKCAALKALMEDGHISEGDIDDRSIREIKADDLEGYTRCHFFAGIGVWDYALQLANWPEEREVWTGSCPCQSFSNAGSRKGMDDERHLWPHWFRLIAERKPVVVFGEQVEAAINHGWLDLVQTDMEGEAYAFTAKGIPAAGIGAPHIRHRLWFVADSSMQRQQQPDQRSPKLFGEVLQQGGCGKLPGDNGMAHHHHQGSQGRVGMPERAGERFAGTNGMAGGMAYNDCTRFSSDALIRLHNKKYIVESCGENVRPGPVNGFWADADWLFCRDGKWRPVESGTFPLAHGYSERVGLLHCAGDAIVAEVAKVFIESYLDVENAFRYI